jgi:deazaflavin-dependent oxidoreductase (nitroreductase family)
VAIPRFVRPFTRHVVNPITRRFAGRLPGFAILTVVGRVTGRRYSVPMNVFRSGDRYALALTYGSDVQWVKNVLATGSAEVRTRGRSVRLTDPRLVTREGRALLPPPVRLFLRLAGVAEFIVMREAPSG